MIYELRVTSVELVASDIAEAAEASDGGSGKGKKGGGGGTAVKVGARIITPKKKNMAPDHSR